MKFVAVGICLLMIGCLFLSGFAQEETQETPEEKPVRKAGHRPNSVERAVNNPKVIAEKNRQEGRELLAKLGEQKGYIRTPEGLIMHYLKRGKGAKIEKTDWVTMHYDCMIPS